MLFKALSAAVFGIDAYPVEAWSAPAAAVTADGTGAVIPGPMRNFLRMAAISQKISPDEVLPLLENEDAVPPPIPPYKKLYFEQYGGGPGTMPRPARLHP